jgi:N-glycosidase YbiA
MKILFYSTRGQYGCFSNFSAHGFMLNGEHWPTSEHYFQAQKFSGHPEHVAELRTMKTPKQVAMAGRSRQRPLRPDWEQVKDEVMRQAVRAKFGAHQDIRAILLSTTDAELIEDTSDDHYWGRGSSGTGKNMLGIILMQIREELRGLVENK